ncbi:CLUMA_CG021470, isoform A [Clunio marinus]|uniref:CLUMA_CG021470, isoform A n=1 Tax=Clunio marinus TaxID=568069 RepID=A0A1J1J871_9DIPT|nr:CLUMA_CG021470, isoform A [Clunio marinus]
MDKKGIKRKILLRNQASTRQDSLSSMVQCVIRQRQSQRQLQQQQRHKAHSLTEKEKRYIFFVVSATPAYVISLRLTTIILSSKDGNSIESQMISFQNISKLKYLITCIKSKHSAFLCLVPFPLCHCLRIVHNKYFIVIIEMTGSNESFLYDK